MSMITRRLVLAVWVAVCVLGAGVASADAATSHKAFEKSMAVPLVEAPSEVVTEPATRVTPTSAKLNGRVMLAHGGTVHYFFEYGTSPSYGTSTAEAEVTVSALTGEASVGAKLIDLEPGASYHYRLVAESLDGEEESFTTGIVAPSEALTEAASNVGPTNATFNGKINPGGGATYYFEYGSAPCDVGAETCGAKVAEGGIGGATQQVIASEVSSLAAGKTYYYWIVAVNELGTVHGQQQTFTTPKALPTVAGEAVTNVGPHGGTLNVQINTQGLTTTYYAEYGTTSSYGSKTAESGIGGAGGTVTVPLTGLTPDTSYHVRIVATSEDGTVQGGDVSFTTFAPVFLGLPDSRVYELVSRAENQERDIEVPYVQNGYNGIGYDGIRTRELFEPAENGDAVAYVGEPSSPGGTGTGGLGAGNEYLSTRGPEGGWTQINLQPPGYLDATYQAFTSELSIGIIASSNLNVGSVVPVRAPLPPLASDAPSGVPVIYARPTSGEAYTPLYTISPPNRGSAFQAYEVAKDSFSGEEPAYAGSSADGSRMFFEGNDALTPNAEAGDGTANNLYESFEGQLNLVNVLPGPEGISKVNATFGSSSGEARPDFSNVISENGKLVFWTDMNTGDIYARESGTSTVPVSAGPARYWTATPNGRYVYYTEGEKLWRFDTESEARIELAGAEVQGVIGVSNDGEYVYFVANGDLATGATMSEPNLYLLHGGTTSFIATLAGEDAHNMQPYPGGVGDLAGALGQKTAEVTPNGQALVFMSSRSLTGYNNAGASEVYVYEYEGKELLCLSCVRTGVRPEPDEESEHGTDGLLQVSWSNTYIPHWISDEGSRVFFNSPVALVPQDTNKTQDVYEWERDGTGSCQESSGCIYLISDGINESASWLIGSSSSGSSVFFVSRSQLVPEDGSEVDVVYDARVSGIPPLTPPKCVGTGCQGIPSAPPVFATPSSVTFNGVGNFPPPSAPTENTKTTTPQTKAQKLAKALKVCRRKPQKKKRAVCELQAKRRYGTKANARKTSKGRK